MKNKIMKLALLLTCGILTPVATNATELNQLQDSSFTQNRTLANSVIYLKAESNNRWNKDEIEPDFGLGYRYRFNHHGIDISTTGRWGIANIPEVEDANFIHLGTQANYLYYFTPSHEGSFYTGIGLGNNHTRVRVKEDEIKHIVHAGQINTLATFGYQHGLNETFSTFFQAQISQTVSRYMSNNEFSIANAWQPTLTFSAGIGF